MTTSSRVLCIPPEVACLTVDRRTRRELHAMAKGRIAFIDYVAYAGTRGLRFGRIRLRWLDEFAPLPDRVVRVSGIAEPILVRADLAPVMVQERAELKVTGLRIPRLLRRLTITLADGGPWLAFVEARATPLGLRGH